MVYLFLVFEGSFLEFFGCVSGRVLLLLQLGFRGNVSVNSGVVKSRLLSVISSPTVCWCCGCAVFLKSVDLFLGFLNVLKGDMVSIGVKKIWIWWILDLLPLS
jgi:hypothetical protein